MICKKLKLAAAPAAVLVFCAMPALSQEKLLTAQTTAVSICGHLFELDSNAAGLTAQQRALTVQKNLDNALVASADRTPSAVRVEIVNRNPVVTLDHFLVVTADGNSASRSNLSQMELAEKWANTIRVCLANSEAVDKYLSMLTGKYPQTKTVLGTMVRDEIAVAPADMLLPVELVTPISTRDAQIGDQIEAVISHDVPLGPSFASYLPAGTLAIGNVESTLPYVPNNYAGKHGFTVNFHELRTPDGKEIPIDAHIYGSIDSARAVELKPLLSECCGNGTTLKDLSLIKVHVNPAKGNIVGSWKGVSIEQPLGETKSMRRLSGIFDIRPTASGLEYGMCRVVFDRRHGLNVAAGQPMLIQLSATTTVAVAGRSM